MIRIFSQKGDRSLLRAVLDSKLGACWECVTICLSLLVLSVFAYVIGWWTIPERGVPGTATGIITMGAIVSMTLFSVLSLAHLCCFVLRRVLDARGRRRQQ